MKAQDEILLALGTSKGMLRTGWFLLVAPTLKDIVYLGIGGFFKWQISHWGIVCMLIGALLLSLRTSIDVWTKKN